MIEEVVVPDPPVEKPVIVPTESTIETSSSDLLPIIIGVVIASVIVVTAAILLLFCCVLKKTCQTKTVKTTPNLQKVMAISELPDESISLKERSRTDEHSCISNEPILV